MSEQRKAISRQELYEKVWATPIVRLAQELGYSYPELIAIIAAQDSLALVHVLRGPDEIFPRIRAAARTRHDVVADQNARWSRRFPSAALFPTALSKERCPVTTASFSVIILSTIFT